MQATGFNNKNNNKNKCSIEGRKLLVDEVTKETIIVRRKIIRNNDPEDDEVLCVCNKYIYDVHKCFLKDKSSQTTTKSNHENK